MSEPTLSPGNPVAIAPLHNPHFAVAFKPLHTSRAFAQAPKESAAAKVPLFLAALLYLAGIALVHCVYLPPGRLLLSLLALAVIAIAAVYSAPRLAWLPMLALWVGLGAWSAAMEPQPVVNARLAACISDGLLRTVEGVVTAAEPVRADSSEDAGDDSDPGSAFLETAVSAGAASKQMRMREQVDIEVHTTELLTDAEDRMEPLPRGGVRRVRLQLYWPAGVPIRELRCGENLRAVIRLVSPQVFRDPGVWNRAAYLETLQVGATASLDATRQDSGAPRFAVTEAASNSPACVLDRIRTSINSRLADLPERSRWMPAWLRVSAADTAMLTALLTGDRSTLTRGIRSGFERTGSFHLIVVSGLHLAIVAGCIFAAARRLRAGQLTATLLTIAAAFLYAVFTGFGAPVQRSFWMVTLYLLGRLLYRHRCPLNVIGFAALCLAAAAPHSIFDASFQMTLLAVTAIAGIAAPLLERGLRARLHALRDLKLVNLDVKLPPRIASFRVLVRLLAEEMQATWGPWAGWRLWPGFLSAGLRAAELLAVTVIVELALTLPMAIYFHRITVYALPVNLFLLPLLGALLPVAMVLLMTIAIWPAAALIPAAACIALLHAGTFVVSRLGHGAAADLRLPEPSAFRALLAFALFVLAVWLVRLAATRGGKPLRLAGISALAGMAVLALAPRTVEHPRGALLFEAIDVGQGDSLLLITPDGHTLLVDGGGLGLPFLTGAKHGTLDTGEDVVSPTLWARGIRRLDAVALTHAHHDHMGGLPAILRNFRPRELWVGENPPVGAYLDLLHDAHAAGVAVHHMTAGDAFAFGDTWVRVLGPAMGYRSGAQPSNEDSLALRMSYGAGSVLLAGDAENAEEQSMLATPDLGSTVLKVGHHGSLTSTRPTFLAAVHPQWAVISCGRKNRFGHPRQEILEELQQAHVRTYRTDSDGATCLALDAQSRVAVSDCGQ